MSKRFTETTKWDGSWFRNLTPVQKCFWLYLVDRCDQAGVIEADYELARMFIKGKVAAKDLAALAENVRVLPNGKLWLPKFVRFQYGTLSRDCKPHLPVFAALARHGLTEADVIAPDTVSVAPTATAAAKVAKTKVADESALAIYSVYPRKEGKVAALKAINAALALRPVADLLAATIAYSEAVAKWPVDDLCYVPHPATWFNKGKYDDDPETWVRTSMKNNHRFAGMKGVDHAKGF